ncbi:MAG: glycosyltransferase family 2 protein [Silicimonas sp.]|nr:glycosyltransferase family 2 protein [Silicimonas sp.]
MAHITAVAPVLNEEGNVKELVTRLAGALSEISPDYAILIVDDGSTDATWARLEDMAAADPRVGGVRFSRNFGQHAAITAGIEAAAADWVVVMDGDLQDRPEVIPDLYAKVNEGWDCVFVERQDRPESSLYLLGQRIFYSTLRGLTKGNYDGAHGNFSIISRRVADAYKTLGEGARFYGGLIDWLGFSRTSIQAKHGERFSGAPSYDFLKRLKFAKSIVLSFSTRPLDLMLAFGLGVTLVAFAFGLAILLRALFSDYAVQGWASLMVSIFFIGGVQISLVGMVGLYVGRIYEEVKGRPRHVIAETLTPTPVAKTKAKVVKSAG